MKARVAVWPLLFLAALPSWVHMPAGLERWLYNARERTETAIRDVDAGRLDHAVRALESAARRDPEDPVVQYNQGTGRSMKHQRDALGPLESAAKALDERPDLASDAWYNLGTARLEFNDPEGAVQALKQALRHNPNDSDAKFNLELALDRLKQKKSGQRSPKETPQGGQQGEKEKGSNQDGSQPSEKKSESPQNDHQQSRQENSPTNKQSPQQQQGPLPQFKPQPDMTAQQAASILEAVENLEREQRRAEAERRVRRLPSGEKDW